MSGLHQSGHLTQYLVFDLTLNPHTPPPPTLENQEEIIIDVNWTDDQPYFTGTKC